MLVQEWFDQSLNREEAGQPKVQAEFLVLVLNREEVGEPSVLAESLVLVVQEELLEVGTEPQAAAVSAVAGQYFALP
ncbi:MAG: hypothetical protein DSZ10_02115 [Sulfurovum sp.]|nr:MAG: hypothetical protein DSZ10_02115 [Sulfurovum sp.]